ncbi:MAG: hypothetical protein ABSC37_13370 [Xanthobacteraceae bacterium]
MDWKKANTLIPWGTVVLFGVGIGLGTALLQTQAAQWLAGLIVQWFGLNQLAGIAVLAVMASFSSSFIWASPAPRRSLRR